jgi:dihydroflavonol-4-reductase
MRVFVTGGTGFIGSHLIGRLLDEGMSVKALVRDRNRIGEFQKLGVEPVVGDVTDRSSIKGVLRGCDVFYHLGSVSRWWLPDRSLYYKVNVEGTRNMMFEALEAGVKKVIYTSSIAAIRQPKGEVTTEESEHKRDFESHYGRSKFLAEKEVLRIYRENGLPVVILNPGVVIGPGDLKTFGRMIIELLNGRLKVKLFEDSVIPVVYIDDVIEGHLVAVDKGRMGERYILVGDNVRIGDVFRAIDEITGVPVSDKKTPPLLIVKLTAYLMELGSFFSGNPPRFAVDAIRAMEVGASGSNRKAKEELGLSFTPLNRALKETVEWYRGNGYVP